MATAGSTSGLFATEVLNIQFGKVKANNTCITDVLNKLDNSLSGSELKF